VRHRRTMPVLAVTVFALVVGATACSSSSSGGSTGPTAQQLAATAAVASPGCKATSATPGQSTKNFAANGKTGDFIQEVPATATTGKPMPLVLDLHGYLEVAFIQNQGSALNSFGNKHGFVVITPELNESGVPRWDFSPNSPDVAWISHLLTHLEDTMCIDERRVYSTGLSMGAVTTSSLACQLSTRIAAAAPVAGVQAFPWCKPTRAVPVVAFHGTADPYIAYTGGPGPTGKTLPALGVPGKTIGQVLKTDPTAAGILPQSIPDQVATWAKRNGCAATPANTSVASDVTLISYQCPADASVELYRIQGGGHTWPGGPSGVYPASIVGRTTHSISADEIMWAFFQAHPLTGPIGS
jgi:polyhydroxybutyrate depolymerase